MYLIRKISMFAAVFLTMSSSITFAQETAPKEWLVWLDNLKKEMISRGISPKTIDKAYGDNTYFHEKPEVIAKDNAQKEFILTSSDYVNKLVSAERVKKAREHYKKLQKKYKTLEKEYDVPLHYLTAFWAIETNFGQNKGKYHLIDGLTNLSYKNRRANFFKNELYNVLKIMEKHELDNEKLMGSWAGAMGHFQFMPSTYNVYAVDYDKDGFVDIWDSFDDAIASASNYLNSLGWKSAEPWGFKIELPWNFNYELSGYNVEKSVKEWQEIGVKVLNDKDVEFSSDIKASIIIPDGKKGYAYMVFPNFKRIMIWNRSENYALAVSKLADYTNSSDKYKPIQYANRYAVTNNEVKKVQAFVNKVLHTKLKEDGILGVKTRNAVKLLQKKAKMTQDGYPDYQLLNKIEQYDTKLGFAVPVQPVKVLQK